jgi:hypothetical protein
MREVWLDDTSYRIECVSRLLISICTAYYEDLCQNTSTTLNKSHKAIFPIKQIVIPIWNNPASLVQARVRPKAWRLMCFDTIPRKFPQIIGKLSERPDLRLTNWSRRAKTKIRLIEMYIA